MTRRFEFRVPVARLREDLQAGFSAVEIGQRHPRPDGHPWPPATVRTACRDLGLPVPRLKDPNLGLLRSALKSSLRLHDVAKACGVTLPELLAICREQDLLVTEEARESGRAVKTSEPRIEDLAAQAEKKPWTNEEDVRLLDLLDTHGYTAAAAAMGRSYGSVFSRHGNLRRAPSPYAVRRRAQRQHERLKAESSERRAAQQRR